MKQPITTETLFEDFVEQIEVAVEAVAAQVPYTPAQIVCIAFTIVENLGLYYDGVKEWRRKTTGDKTWENFKVFFSQEFREVRPVPRTSRAEGYAQFCVATGQANAVLHQQMQETHATALANLATATASDRKTVSDLTATNARLQQELTTASAVIAALQHQVASLHLFLTPPGVLTVPIRQPPPYCMPGPPPTGPTPPTTQRSPLDPNGYCWTHRYWVSMTHNGRTCDNTAPGHQREATRANTMKGSTKGKSE